MSYTEGDFNLRPSRMFDLDGDGWSFDHDFNDGDATQWNDTDGDGFGDNWDNPDWNESEFTENLS